MNWMDQPYDLFSGLFKAWVETQKNAFQTFAAAASGSGTIGAAGAKAPALNPLFAMNEMWKSSLETWVGLMQQPSPEGLSEEALRNLFDPTHWTKASQDPFHAAIEHLAAGPNYADLWMLDKKFIRAQQLRVESERDVGAYHAVLRAAWKKAFDRFVREVNRDGKPITTWRALTDLWIKVANDTLTEMHRTPEFLEAQRSMTRSATEYRLQQREIIEAFCEANHIPTRTEVDEVQRAVYELRRKLRSLTSTRKEAGAAKASSGTPSLPAPDAANPRTKVSALAAPEPTAVAVAPSRPKTASAKKDRRESGRAGTRAPSARERT